MVTGAVIPAFEYTSSSMFALAEDSCELVKRHRSDAETSRTSKLLAERDRVWETYLEETSLFHPRAESIFVSA